MLMRKTAFALILAILAFASFGCRFSFTMDPEAAATETPLPSSTPPAAISTLPSPVSLPTDTLTPATPTTAAQPTSAPSGPYAVILVSPGDVLNIRSAAGVDNPVVASFDSTASDVMRTGPSAQVGGSLWVEVQGPGGKGWVNSDFLTEYVAPSAFCADAQVTALLNTLKSALLNSDGGLLAALASPVHGLDLRLWRYGTLVNYDSEHAKFVFESTYQVDWGPAPGSGQDTVGSLSQAVLPKLTEVFGADFELHCDSTMELATFSLEPWPPEYANINFYAVHKPGTEIYGGLDWRTWLVGVEYVGGKPFLFSLIHFQWEP